MRAISFLLLLLALAYASPVRAEEPAAPAATSQPAASPTAKPKPHAVGWGAGVIATGVIAGGALAAYGLTFDCGEASLDCQKRAAIAFWGGIGIAALASALGIAIIQSATEPDPKRAAVRIDFAGPGVLLHGTF